MDVEERDNGTDEGGMVNVIRQEKGEIRNKSTLISALRRLALSLLILFDLLTQIARYGLKGSEDVFQWSGGSKENCFDSTVVVAK